MRGVGSDDLSLNIGSPFASRETDIFSMKLFVYVLACLRAKLAGGD
jgi:hypothetical protein